MRLEVGHNEIGDADEPDKDISSEIAAYFPAVGLPEPGPVPLMPLHYQVAQKLHAPTSPGSRRAHDLIDLQIVFACGQVDLALTRKTRVRLFAYRKQQDWPPVVVAGEGWDRIYQEERAGTDVLPELADAIAWANDIIARIDAT